MALVVLTLHFGVESGREALLGKLLLRHNEWRII